MMLTKSLHFLVVIISVQAARSTYFTSQQQITPRYCLHHNLTLDDASLTHCAYFCSRSTGCRVIVYNPTARACMGCQYVMDQNYAVYNFDDEYDVPVEIPAGSILYAPAVTRYGYRGCYIDCMVVITGGSPCVARALPQEYGPDYFLTTEQCFEFCKQYGSQYFGTQAKYFCFCGLVYDKLGMTDRCSTTCGGNTSQTCGGHLANSVYEIIVRN